jgi:hypothetical protein
MNKKVVFVGMHTKHMAVSHMKALIGELVMKGVTVWKKNKHDFTFETPNVYVRYVCSGDKSVDLIGMRADAVFGTVYDSMKFHMKPGADQWSNLGLCAFEYIYNVEFDALKGIDYVKNDVEITKEVAENFQKPKPSMLIEVDTASMDDPDEMLAEVFKYAYTIADREVRIRVV